MSTHEIIAAFSLIYTTLTADTTLTSLLPGGVNRSIAPLNTQTPFCVMSLQAGGNDTLTANAIRVLTNPLLQVKIVGEAAKTMQIAQAAARVDDLLKYLSGTVQGAYIAACYREQPFQLDEMVAGVLWTSIGGLYRMNIQQIS